MKCSQHTSTKQDWIKGLRQVDVPMLLTALKLFCLCVWQVTHSCNFGVLFCSFLTNITGKSKTNKQTKHPRPNVSLSFLWEILNLMTWNCTIRGETKQFHSSPQKTMEMKLKLYLVSWNGRHKLSLKLEGGNQRNVDGKYLKHYVVITN